MYRFLLKSSLVLMGEAVFRGAHCICECDGSSLLTRSLGDYVKRDLYKGLCFRSLFIDLGLLCHDLSYLYPDCKSWATGAILLGGGGGGGLPAVCSIQITKKNTCYYRSIIAVLRYQISFASLRFSVARCQVSYASFQVIFAHT